MDKFTLQSAMEYLLTYGWAIMIIAVALAVLFASGVFNPSISQQCLMQSGFNCVNYFMSDNGLLSVSLLQTMQAPINVTALGCNENSIVTNMQEPYSPPSNQIMLDVDSNYTFTVQCYGNSGTVFSGSPGSMYKGYIIVNYTNIETGFPQTAYGSIAVKVS